MFKTLEGFVDDGKAAPLAGVPAIATVVGTGVVVGSTATDANGHWQFDDLPDSDEYFVNVVDIDGNAVVRGPWSGEVRDVWVRDRLSMSGTGIADLPTSGRTLVGGLPLVLDPSPANGLEWSATGLFSASGGLTQDLADTLYEPLDSAYTKSESDARYAELADVDPFPQYLTSAEATALFEPLDSAYTKAESDARYAELTDVDPFPQYLTPAEANALYEPFDSAYTKAEADARYTQGGITQAAADLRYEPLDSAYTKSEDDARFVNLAGGSVMTGLLGPTSNNTRDLGTTALRWRKLWAVDGEFTNAPTVGGVAVLTATSAGLLYEPLDSAYTKSEADARYEPIDTMYTKAEADARYEPLDSAYTKAEDDARFVNLAGGSVMTGLLGPSTHNTRDLGTTGTRWRALYGMTGDFTTSLTVATKPLVISPDAANIVEWRANGFYAAAGAVSDIWVNTTGDTMTGDLNMTANVLPTVTNVRDLGTTALRWKKLWATDTELTGAATITNGGANPASAGALRLPNSTAGRIAWRNAANSADINLEVDGGNVLTWGGSTLVTHALGDTRYLMPATAASTYVELAGDTMTGQLTVSNVLTVTNANANPMVWNFTATGGQSFAINTAATNLIYNHNFSAGPADQKKWEYTYKSDSIVGRVVNDAYNSAQNWLEVIRSGATITRVDLSAGTKILRLDAAGLVSVPTALTVNSRPVIMAGCRVYHNANQTTTTGVAFRLAFNSERFDTDNYHDLVTNNSRLTIPAGLAGKYLITATLRFASNATGYRQVYIWHNASAAIAAQTVMAMTGLTTDVSLATVWDMAVGDYVELFAVQLSGGNLDVQLGSYHSPEFTMQRIG